MAATIRGENITTTTASTPIEETYRTSSSRAMTELVVVGTMTTDKERELSATPTVMEDSGDDLSTTITLVAPRKDFICPAPSKVSTPVQETSLLASAELACSSNPSRVCYQLNTVLACAICVFFRLSGTN